MIKAKKVSSYLSVPWRLLGILVLVVLSLGIGEIVNIATGEHFYLVLAIASIVYPLAMALLCLRAFLGIRAIACRPLSRRLIGRGYVPLCLGLGILLFTLGQVAWLIEVSGRPGVPFFPSLAYYTYLGIYPFFMLAILLLPVRDLSAPARLRIFLDSLIMMTIVTTLCYYYFIAPSLMGTHQGLLGKAVGAAYPLADLMLLFCLLLVAFRAEAAVMGPMLMLLGGAVLIMFMVDLFELDEVLYRNYKDALWVNMGWMLIVTLIATAALTKDRMWRGTVLASDVLDNRAELVSSTATFFRWKVWMPSILTLLYCLHIFFIWLTRNGQVFPGQIWIVYFGSFLALFLLVVRQLLSIDEVGDLQRKLQTANRSLSLVNGHLEKLAASDPLTGLLNHRAMVELINKQLNFAARKELPCTLLFLDIDRFKDINDCYGHQFGDEVLVRFAGIVKEALSKEMLNTAGNAALGRWGGEEFLVVLPGLEADEALQVAERVRASVACQAFVNDAHLRVWVTCSLGVATYPQDAQSHADLVRCADAAMYAAKRLGRNQAHSAREPMVLALGMAKEPSDVGKENGLLGIVRMLMILLEKRDRALSAHGRRVALLAMRLARQLGLSGVEVRRVGLAGLLHDVGKVAVPDAILFKQEKLDEEEYEWVMRHSLIGAEVLQTMLTLREVGDLVRGHHEWMDGSGYPDKLAGEAIPLGARILAVVDVCDALTTARPYHLALSTEDAQNELRARVGTQFDPRIVEALIGLLSSRPYTTVALEDRAAG